MDLPYLARSGKETPRAVKRKRALSRFTILGTLVKLGLGKGNGERRFRARGSPLGKETIESLSFSSPVLLSFLALPLLARGYIRDIPDSINYGTVVALKIYEQDIYIFVFSVFPNTFSALF